MKKLLLLLSVLCSLSIKAQFAAGFAAGFGQADPDAWFDKEPYFWCQNQTGYQLTNIYLVYNNDKVYELGGLWQSGTYIILGKEDGISLSSGDVVSVYYGNQCIGTLVCPKSQTANLPHIRGGGKATRALRKNIWKLVKRLR